MRVKGCVLSLVLFSLLALSAAAPLGTKDKDEAKRPTQRPDYPGPNASPEEKKAFAEKMRNERKAEVEQKRKRAKEDWEANRAAAKPSGAKAFAEGAKRPSPEEMRRRQNNKAQRPGGWPRGGPKGNPGALFTALTKPMKPVKIEIPLSEANELIFLAARDGLTKAVENKADEYDMSKPETREKVQQMTEQHQKEVLEIMIEAVKGGSTMQEARIGMMIAQFNALPQAIKDEALANAKVRQEKMPQGHRERMAERVKDTNHQERTALEAMDSNQRAEWVKERYKPARPGARAPPK